MNIKKKIIKTKTDKIKNEKNKTVKKKSNVKKTTLKRADKKRLKLKEKYLSKINELNEQEKTLLQNAGPIGLDPNGNYIYPPFIQGELEYIKQEREKYIQAHQEVKELNINVYLVYDNEQPKSEISIHGIFSSLEKAIEYIESIERNDLFVDELVLDTPENQFKRTVYNSINKKNFA